MNEFQAKKLGEVLAFGHVFINTFEKGRESFLELLGEKEYHNFFDTNALHVKMIEDIAKNNAVTSTVSQKAEKTGKKLLDMRKLYLETEEDWNTKAEVLEWSSFFEGAATAHWALVVGFSERQKDVDLFKLAEEGYAFHLDLFRKIVDELKETGKKEN